MDFLQAYSKEIVSLLVPIITAVVAYFLRPRAKIVWSITRNMALQVEETRVDSKGKPIINKAGEPVLFPALVRTTSLFFKNVGREAAADVEIVFNWQPPYFNLWPQRHYEVSTNPEKRFVFRIGSLAANEFIGIDILSVNNVLPEMIQIRSQQGVAKNIVMVPQRVYAKWQHILAGYAMLAGCVVTIYIFITAVQFFARLGIG